MRDDATWHFQYLYKKYMLDKLMGYSAEDHVKYLRKLADWIEEGGLTKELSPAKRRR